VASAPGTIEMSGIEDRSNPGSLLDIPVEARSPAISDLFFQFKPKMAIAILAYAIA
jgi:hypothetical protein